MGSTFTKIPPSIFYITFNPPPPHPFLTLSSRHFKALFCQTRRSSIGNQKLRFPSLYTISNPDPDLSLHCSRETPQSWTLDRQGALLASAMLTALAKIIALQKSLLLCNTWGVISRAAFLSSLTKMADDARKGGGIVSRTDLDIYFDR